MSVTTQPDVIKQPGWPKLRDVMGPGLITGASDDDPSGIATYSQAGAQFGYGLGWTMLFTCRSCAPSRKSRARRPRHRHGIAGKHAPALSQLAARSLVALLLVANTINLGADLGAMARPCNC